MKYALLVGIDKYSYSDWNLAGCKNDVLDMYDLLTDKYSFERDDVRVVVDERATKDGILRRLEWLVKKLSRGGVGVFYYSGHGTRVRDRDGDESLFDYMDEALVPHDAYPDNFLLDDEIAQILHDLSDEASLYVIFDCCHSGTATRVIPITTPEAMLSMLEIDISDSFVRYVEPPLDVALRSYGRFLPIKRLWDYLVELVSGGEEKNITIDTKLNHCFMSAAKDDEVSLEVVIKGKRRGVFTYHFCKVLRQLSNNLSIEDVYQIVYREIKRAGFAQTPQLEMAGKFKLKQIFT